MDKPEHNQPKDQPGPPGAGKQPAGAIDLEQLTEKVYRLMLADLRLEHARGGRAPRRKGR